MLDFEKKTVVVLGAARQGLALAKYAAGHGAHVIITDQKQAEQLHTAMDSMKEYDLLIITADHGNSEQMIDYKTGEPHTAHTTNLVPLILISDKDNLKLKDEGKLADLSPTILDLMEIEQPEEMTGVSLLEKE